MLKQIIMDPKYCYIFNHENGSVSCIHLECGIYQLSDFEEDEDLIRYWGFKPSQCSWMFTNNEQIITHILKPLK